MSKADRQPKSAPGPDAHAATEELQQSADVNSDEDPRAEKPAVDSGANMHRRDQLEVELDEAKGAALRSQAELENFRKRMRREMEEERRYAIVPLVRDLLNVLDNMHRAISAAEESGGTSGLLEGVKMVSDQFLAVLQQNNCQPIPAVGATFDPNLHEAIGQETSAEFPANVVSRETRVGYQLHGRVVRPSQVFVSTGPPMDNPAAPQ